MKRYYTFGILKDLSVIRFIVGNRKLWQIFIFISGGRRRWRGAGAGEVS